MLTAWHTLAVFESAFPSGSADLALTAVMVTAWHALSVFWGARAMGFTSWVTLAVFGVAPDAHAVLIGAHPLFSTLHSFRTTAFFGADAVDEVAITVVCASLTAETILFISGHTVAALRAA